MASPAYNPRKLRLVDSLMQEHVKLPGFPQLIVTRGFALEWLQKELGNDEQATYAAMQAREVTLPLTDTETRDKWLHLNRRNPLFLPKSLFDSYIVKSDNGEISVDKIQTLPGAERKVRELARKYPCVGFSITSAKHGGTIKHYAASVGRKAPRVDEDNSRSYTQDARREAKENLRYRLYVDGSEYADYETKAEAERVGRKEAGSGGKWRVKEVQANPVVVHQGRAYNVKNLGWLRSHWKDIESIEIHEPTEKQHGMHRDTAMVATTRDGKTYTAFWYDVDSAVTWLKRLPTMRDIPYRVIHGNPLTGSPSHDIPLELRHGRSQRQAEAIAMEAQRRLNPKSAIPPLNDWHEHAGGTFAARDRSGYTWPVPGVRAVYHIDPYSAKYNSNRHLGYMLKGTELPGSAGLWTDLGTFRSAAQAVTAARRDWEKRIGAGRQNPADEIRELRKNPRFVNADDVDRSPLSPYRKDEFRRYLADGWGMVRLVDQMPRGGAPLYGFRGDKAAHELVVRGSTSGRYGKSVMVRVFPLRVSSNPEGFKDARGRFHPIRGGDDYDPDMVGETGKDEFGYVKRRNPHFKIVRWSNDDYHIEIDGKDSGEGATSYKAAQALVRKMKESARTGRRNPDDSGSAAELYAEFHGEPSDGITDYEETVELPDDYVELGDLTELKVATLHGKDVTIAAPDPDRYDIHEIVKLACSPDGRQLYFIGGDQKLQLDKLGFKNGEIKPHMFIGVLYEATYRTRKGFDKFKLTDYFHALGEESGNQPMLNYDSVNCLMSVVGGSYHVKAEGIVD